MNADRARFNLRFATAWLVSTVSLLTLGNAAAFNRQFDLHLQNGTTEPVTFTIVMGSCYQGTGYYPPYQLTHGPVQPGNEVTIHIARVQGHGCDGEQGWFAILPSGRQEGGRLDQLQWLWFDNAGILEVKSLPTDFDGSLSAKSPIDESYTWTMREPDETLVHPRNPVARNLGNWSSGTQFNELTFRRNGYKGMSYSECGTAPLMHAQHIVRTPNRNGRAYFIVTNSDMHLPKAAGIGPTIPWPWPATPAGRMSVYRADAIDEHDLIVDQSGTDGEIVWEHTFDSDSPIGAWNHPAKMELIGNVLVVAMQDWAADDEGVFGYLCRDGAHTSVGSEMALVFFDVRDPENPRYWGSITKGELGTAGVEEVSLVQAGHEWILSTKNRWWRTTSVSPNLRDWTFGGTQEVAGNLQGQYFNSLELYDALPDWVVAPDKLVAPDRLRSIYGNGDCDSCSVYGSDYILTFKQLNFAPPSDPSVRSLFPTVTASVARQVHLLTSSAPNLWTTVEEIFGKHHKDYDSDGVSVRRGMPVFYSPLVYFRSGFPQEPPACDFIPYCNYYETAGDVLDFFLPDKIYQVWNPANYGLQTPHPNQVVKNADDHGPGSLRQAIAYGGTVTFAPGLNGATIRLTSGPLSLFSNVYADLNVAPGNPHVIIDASALTNGITISGDANGNGIWEVGTDSGVFEIGHGVRVTMRNLTIRDGVADLGAGILNNGGTLILEGSTVTRNYAVGFGGGIANFGGTLTVERSTVAANKVGNSDVGDSGGRGGGIGNWSEYGRYGPDRFGIVLIVNSTIANNTSDELSPFGVAGLFNDYGGSMIIVHSTVAGNKNLVDTGFAGVYNEGSLALENSIVANNLSGAVGRDLSGPYWTVGANIVQTNLGTKLTGPAPLTGNPFLGPLRYDNNGGVTTPTMGLLPQSPAIDAAVASTGSYPVITDQRGVPRPIGPASDLGAVEAVILGVSPAPGEINVALRPTLSWTPVPGATFEVFFDFGSGFVSQGQITSASMELGTALAPNTQYTWRVTADFAGRRVGGESQSFTTRGSLVVTTVADENDSGLGQGSGNSLRELIAAALPGETITFAAGLSGQTIALDGTQLVIAKSLTIDATSLPDGIRIDARGNSRVFSVSGTGTVEMRKLTLTGGYSSLGGAVINEGAALTLYDSALTDNRSPDFGGGIYNRNGGALSVRFSTLSRNSAPQGGGIYHDGAGGSSLSVQFSTLADHYASSQGGGLLVTGGGTPRIETSTLARNAANAGGGLFIQGGTMLIQNSTLAGNSSIADQGAAIRSEGSANLTLRHVTVAKNIGVGIVNTTPAILTLDNSIVANNFNGLNSASDLIGNFTAVGANLVRVRSGTLAAGPAPITLDPLLDELGSYGYRTEIMQPLAGSPVINAGVATVNTPANDQSNALRINGAAPDLGSVESFLSSVATLQWLTTSAGTITPAFQPLLTSYTATVASTVSTAAVRPSQANFNATVQVRINGGAYVPVNQGAASPALPLNPGENTIEVKVIAQDGVTTKVYTLAVIRGAPSVRNANLASLTTGSGSLAPVFSPAVSAYHVTVANATASTTVTAVSSDALATIALRANVGSYSPLASGAASAPIPLNVGANPIDVRVTARDGITTATYRLVVTREAPAASNANLAALSTSAGALSPSFASGLAFYKVNVSDSVTAATVTASPVQPTATIAVRANGGAFSNVASGVASAPMTLVAGTNVLEVKVTAQDGVTVRSYQIIVDRIVDDIEWASKRRLAPQAGGNDQSLDAAISSDGRFVAFSSRATNLVDGDTNNREDVFVFDRVAQAVERVSVDNAGVQGNHDSGHPSISADGRFVAFQSRASNLVANDTNGQIDASRGQDIFVYDRTAKTIERVSLRDNGGESNGASETPSISGDGRYVAFASGANNLVTGYANGQVNVYIHDRTTHGIVGISVPLGAFVANRNSLNPVISTDGNFVAFEFAVDKSVDSTPAYQYRDIYVYNRANEVVKRVTGTDDSLLANGIQSRAPSISADGRLIAFQSNLANIDFYDANGQVDVFVHDQIDGVTRLVSIDRTGTVQCVVGGCDATNPSISGDGRRVAFQSGAINLVTPNTNGTSHIFMKDLDTGEISVLSVNSASAQANGDSGSPAVSFDGRAVAFESLATNLASPDTNGNYDVFVSATAAPASSSLADLSSLVASVGAYAPLFSPGVTSYSVVVANSVDTVLVRPTAADPNATIALRVNSGAFAAIASNAISAPLNLNLGANSIEVKVTAQNGTTTKSYILTVTRGADSNAELASLVPLTDTVLPLTPAFAGGTTSYSASVAKGTAAVTVIPTVAHAGATVKVNGVSVISGAASGPIGLAVGNNSISAVVTAADGTTTKSYVLTVTRAVNTPPVANPRTINVVQGGEVVIVLSGSDADGDTLTTSVVTLPTRGTIRQVADYLVYTPNVGGTGADSFTFKVNDGSADSAAAAVTLEILPQSVLAPTVVTGPASAVSATRALLNGTVSSNGANTTVTFQYGPTAAYGSTATATQSPLAAGAANAPVLAAITGLACNKLYHFRVVGANSVNTTSGADATFTTAACNTLGVALNVALAGSGGEVTSNPLGITCGTDCSTDYPASTVVTLIATPDAGSVFSGWGGSCTGVRICTLAMSADRFVAAAFTFTGAGSAGANEWVQKAYVSYYGRPADPGGLAFWASRLDAEGGSLSSIIASFGNSDEFNRRYGGLSYVALVTKIYQQALGRDPEQGGLDYYVGELQAGRRTLQSITLDVLNGATGLDELTVANRLDVANHYTGKVAVGCAYGTEATGSASLTPVNHDWTTAWTSKLAIETRCGN